MEEIISLNGNIISYCYPKQGVFYQEIENVMFRFRTFDKKLVLVKGYSFQLRVKEALTIQAKLVGKGQQNLPIYEIVTIKRMMSRSSLKTSLSSLVGKELNYSLVELETMKNILTTSEEPVSELKNHFGMSSKEAEETVARYKKQKAIVDFAERFAEYNFTYKEVGKIVSKLGENAERIIRENPYKLMIQLGWSFQKCDIIAFKSGIKVDSLKRISAGIVSSIKDGEASGNIYSLKDYIVENTYNLLQYQDSSSTKKVVVPQERIEEVYNVLLEKNCLKEEDNCIFSIETYSKILDLRNYFERNGYYPSYIVKESEIDSEIREFELEKGFKLGKEQKLAVKNSLTHRVSIITGGPGTGKTTVLACIMWIAMRAGITTENTALCAPTGKASRRMMESINGQLGTKMIATTIHTLLKVDPVNPNLDTFIFNENNKLDKKFIVCDESSMIDSSIASAFVKAIPDGAQVIFVGDINQLPPVSYGNFLNDIIEAEIPCVKLIEVHRQKGDSSIIGLSQNIRDNKYLDLGKKKDFSFIENNDWSYQEKLDFIVKIYGKATDDGKGKHNFEKAVVLTAINGEIGTEQLGIRQINEAIQKTYNPLKENEPCFKKNGYVFHKGSKVMVTKNNNQLGVVNGQTGYILCLDENEGQGSIVVRFEEQTLNELTGKFEPKISDITFTGEALDHLVLAYAMTVHKSQGSEWQNVIEVVDEDARFMNSKKLVYTGITRAKSTLVLFGSKSVMESLKSRKETPRNSCIFINNQKPKIKEA